MTRRAAKATPPPAETGYWRPRLTAGGQRWTRRQRPPENTGDALDIVAAQARAETRNDFLRTAAPDVLTSDERRVKESLTQSSTAHALMAARERQRAESRVALFGAKKS